MNKELGSNTTSHSNPYQEFLKNSTNIELTIEKPQDIKINPDFKNLKKWVNCYLGPATAQLNDINSKSYPAIRDCNRNAIIPNLNTEINGRKMYLSVKGVGAYEDMFFGGLLTPDKIKKACRDPELLKSGRIDKLTTGLGLIMGESWMGESPYGAQGDENALVELQISELGNKGYFNGVNFCPVIGIARLPNYIEAIARKFYWCRAFYPNETYYQVVRLVPSHVRLYFESAITTSDPKKSFAVFGIDQNKDDKAIEKFEMKFIKSSIALLSLFTRSITEISNNSVSGLTYKDVWFDKDCIVSPDGTVYFADLEGLVRKTISVKEYKVTQELEWEKLVFEFLHSLIVIDTYRRERLGYSTDNWDKQRKELAMFTQLALDNDPFAYTEIINGNLAINIENKIIESKNTADLLPKLTINLFEKIN